MESVVVTMYVGRTRTNNMSISAYAFSIIHFSNFLIEAFMFSYSYLRRFFIPFYRFHHRCSPTNTMNVGYRTLVKRKGWDGLETFVLEKVPLHNRIRHNIDHRIIGNSHMITTY